MRADPTSATGPLLFVRYAYPPNSLGYCGPADSAAFREYGASGVVDEGLVDLARAFSGAWPYLELIASGCGIADPLDRRVVEAYWVGNTLLDAIPLARTADSMETRFRPLIGRQFPHLVDNVLAGGVPHHSFHVFGVYPWVGLLGDDRKADRALTVLTGAGSAGARWLPRRLAKSAFAHVACSGTAGGSASVSPSWRRPFATWAKPRPRSLKATGFHCTGTGSATDSPVEDCERCATTPRGISTWSTAACPERARWSRSAAGEAQGVCTFGMSSSIGSCGSTPVEASAVDVPTGRSVGPCVPRS